MQLLKVASTANYRVDWRLMTELLGLGQNMRFQLAETENLNSLALDFSQVL